MLVAGAITRRALADSRVRNGAFACLFALVSVVQAVGYRNSFPTPAERAEFARSFGENAALRLFYGTPHDLLTVGGYAAWRVGGVLSVFAGMWGLLAAVRALRTEEDAGRLELVLAGIVTRRTAFAAAMAAVAAGVVLLWAAVTLGLVLGRLPAGASAYLALAIASAAAVFAGVGALACQIAPTRRVALEIGAVALAAAFLARVVADTSSALSWLRWLTPLGWAEELRAFTGARPAVLLLPAAATALLVVAAGALARRRDAGTGLLRAGDSAPPRLRLLSSTTAHALRSERGSLIGWLAGVGIFALVLGIISDTFSPQTVGPDLQRRLAQISGASITTPTGALSFYALFFVLAFALFACGQVAAARHEESGQQLETVLALSVDRRRWLGGRLALAAVALATLALAAALLSWLGAATQSAGVSLADMLAAQANALPAALLFLGLGTLAFATVPRAGPGIAYGLVAVSFVWELVGSVLDAPTWALDLSPFHHVGLVPLQPFKATAAVVMLAGAAATAAAAVAVFRRRDLVTA